MAAGSSATPAPAPAPQQAEVPAEVVISELTAVDDGKKLVQPWALPAERIAEMDVYDANGKTIQVHVTGEQRELLRVETAHLGVAQGKEMLMDHSRRRNHPAVA